MCVRNCPYQDYDQSSILLGRKSRTVQHFKLRLLLFDSMDLCNVRLLVNYKPSKQINNGLFFYLLSVVFIAYCLSCYISEMNGEIMQV